VEDSNKHIIEEIVRQVGHLPELKTTVRTVLWKKDYKNNNQQEQQPTITNNNRNNRSAKLHVYAEVFFLKIFIAQKIQGDTQGYKIVPLTYLP